MLREFVLVADRFDSLENFPVGLVSEGITDNQFGRHVHMHIMLENQGLVVVVVS